jgi:hypothetical protein
MSNTTQVLQKIPCLDLKGQHEQVKAEVFAAFERVYEKTAFSGMDFPTISVASKHLSLYHFLKISFDMAP